EGVYVEKNIMTVINFAMEEKFSEKKTAPIVEAAQEFNFEIKSSRIEGISDGLEVSRDLNSVNVEYVVEIIENEKVKDMAKKVASPRESTQEKGLKMLKSNVLKDLSTDEVSLMEFLIDNPDHAESTVGLYKKVGLSPRRGNNAKKDLLGKDLILVHEEKNEKGWKKYVRVSQELGNYMQVHTA
ncbi:hypothetical protein KAR91_15160, partial [Candidatus Pacearchaeota archaeon]|nr:hypothetical protein [Candidatus Pacearchaeota archaeon]